MNRRHHVAHCCSHARQSVGGRRLRSGERSYCLTGRLCILACLLFCVTAAFAQDEDEQFTVIKARRAITVAGEELPQAEIVLVDGKIRLVGQSLEYPKSARVIDACGETVMPGMIYARSRWQLPRYSRSGVHGDWSAAKEVYLDQIDMQPLVEAGFTAVCFYPYGSGIPGPAAVFHTAGADDARELGEAYLRVTMTNPAGDKKVLREAVDRAKKEIEKVDKARKEWDEKKKKEAEEAAKKAAEAKQGDKPAEEKQDTAAAESEKKDEAAEAKSEEKKPEEFTPPKIDPAVLPFVHWLRDEQDQTLPLLFELSSASDLIHLDDVLETMEKLSGSFVYLSGTNSTDFHNVLDELGERKALVLIEPWISMLPSTVTRYNLTAALARAGCRVALLPTTDSPSALHEYRSRVADLVRAGLPRDIAIKTMTLYPAEAAGLAETHGAIEKGKHADLIFLDRDPLDPHARVTRVMIQGEIVWERP